MGDLCEDDGVMAVSCGSNLRVVFAKSSVFEYETLITRLHRQAP